MAQPDIVIGQDYTTVVKNLRVGTARSTDPNVRLTPGANADLRLGTKGVTGGDADITLSASDSSLDMGAGGAGTAGEITLHDSSSNPGVTLSTAGSGSQDASVSVDHPSGPGIDVTVRDAPSQNTSNFNHAVIDLSNTSTAISNGLRLFMGKRLGDQVSGLESTGGRGGDNPQLLFVRAGTPKEIRAYPQVTIGQKGETSWYKPGQLRMMGGPAEQRKITVHVDGGVNTEGGLLSLRTEDELETVRLEGKPAGAPGGCLTLQDTSRKTNVELRGDEGLVALGSSTQNANSAGTQGRLTLDDGTGDTVEITAADGTIIFETDSEGRVLEIETNPTQGSKEIRTKYKINEQSL